MTKEQILALIKKTAQENGEKALGGEKFAKETGIKKNDWLGKHWTKWSDALKEAGFDSNQFNSAYDINHILSKLCEYIRELGHFPTRAELKIKRYNDQTFPSHGVWENQLGNKSQMIAKIIAFVEKEGFEDIKKICLETKIKPETEEQLIDINSKQTDEQLGYVYLLKSGKYYKIGRTNDVGRRTYDLKIQLPDKLELIHQILTDDPVGIENYWHERFKDKKRNGEWFDLENVDIKAFKKRKFM